MDALLYVLTEYIEKVNGERDNAYEVLGRTRDGNISRCVICNDTCLYTDDDRGPVHYCDVCGYICESCATGKEFMMCCRCGLSTCDGCIDSKKKVYMLCNEQIICNICYKGSQD